jgi:hypothetical protein
MTIQEKLDQLTPIELEYLSELAEDFLYNKGIELTSHSYRNIITLAHKHGFKISNVTAQV